jgi:hypothetical protein
MSDESVHIENRVLRMHILEKVVDQRRNLLVRERAEATCHHHEIPSYQFVTWGIGRVGAIRAAAGSKEWLYQRIGLKLSPKDGPGQDLVCRCSMRWDLKIVSRWFDCQRVLAHWREIALQTCVPVDGAGRF